MVLVETKIFHRSQEFIFRRLQVIAAGAVTFRRDIFYLGLFHLLRSSIKTIYIHMYIFFKLTKPTFLLCKQKITVRVRDISYAFAGCYWRVFDIQLGCILAKFVLF